MLPSQRLTPGVLEPAFLRERAALLEHNALAMLWSRAPGLWSADETNSRDIQNCLGWLQITARMRRELPRLTEFVSAARRDDLNDVLFLGVGSCVGVAELLATAFPSQSGRKFRVLGRLDAAAMHAVESEFDLRRTLFLIASRSGTTIETYSQFMFFLNRVKQLGVAAPAQRFAVITGEGSHLQRLAIEYRTRAAFLNPSDVPGDYSALSFFGLLPAALLDIDVAAMLDSAEELGEACGPSAATPSNSALALAALLGAGAMEGRDKLILLGSPSGVPLCRWIEQLVAGSTCRLRTGVVPVVEQWPLPSESFLPHSMVAVVRKQGETDAALDQAVSQLLKMGVPLVEISLSSATSLGAEFLKWQLATALACAILGVNPFDRLNVRESKATTASLLDRLHSGKSPAERTPRLEESGIELYVEGPTRQSISSLSLSEALRTFLELRPAGGFLALLAYVDRFEAHSQALESLRRRLEGALEVPVLLRFGPCYLYSHGPMHKSGPDNGLCLMITARSSMDLLVPGETFGFAQLHMAQALADLESLARCGKEVIRLHLTRGPEEGLRQFEAILQVSLSRLRPVGG